MLMRTSSLLEIYSNVGVSEVSDIREVYYFGYSLYEGTTIISFYPKLNTSTLINYHPFAFTASGGINVGLRYALDIWFVTIHISVEIGATLFLQGPPISGFVHVNFWVLGFNIHFGPQKTPPSDPASLPVFYHLVLQKGSPSAGTTAPIPHVFAVKSGLIPSAIKSSSDNKDKDTEVGGATPEDKIWEVHAGTFTFTITSVFALKEAKVYPGSSNERSITTQGLKTAGLYARLMHIQEELTSTLKVEMEIDSSSGKDYQPAWKLKPLLSQVSKASWDKYNEDHDPIKGSTALLSTDIPSTVTELMGILLIPPKPALSHDMIPTFDAVESQVQDVMDPVEFKPSIDANSSWAPVPPTPPPEDDLAKPWEAVQDLWKAHAGPGGAAESTVETWRKVMGWKDKSVRGKMPKRLVDDLTKLYVAAPMIAVA
ncbi:hypothetical protein BDZ91DRAFT_799132 [Kalaharituber pfeilii]|nr:hypothetical protein BDZ91DRAFT_799132 [Kalaharituber pfeilii]